MQINAINTRADLDALEGTPEHAQFIAILCGSIYRLEKDDETKTWKVVEDTTMIERFDFTRADFADVHPPELPEYIAPPFKEENPKMTGVEFEGVMCSATKEDQSGLTSVLIAYQMQGQSFTPTRYDFQNGNALVLTKDNILAFAAVWMPFRQSFFKI